MTARPPCPEWEEQLSALHDHGGKPAAALEKHLEECPACRQALAAHKTLGMRLRTLRTPAVAESREAILAELEKPGRGRQRFASVLIAAAAMVLLAALYSLLVNAPADASGRDFGGYFEIASLQEQESFESGDPSALEQWCAEQLGFEPRLPSWPWADWKSARLCSIDGEKVAVFRLMADGQYASLFIHPPMAEPPGMPTRQQPYISEQGGYAAVCWQEDGFEYILVSSVQQAGLFGRLAEI